MSLIATKEFRIGKGKISGVISIFLGILCVLSVLCFHFPEILTTPQLRQVYPIDLLRKILGLSIFTGVFFGVISFLLSEKKRFAVTGLCLGGLARVMGGAQVIVPEAIEPGGRYLGLDWFVLDLFMLALVFIPLERTFAQKPLQRIFRRQWKVDLMHFFVSHVLFQAITYLIFLPSLLLTQTLSIPWLRENILQQPLWLQFLEIILLADFVQYWVHRCFHRIHWLWRFHAIHHSSDQLDWLAGSRLHLFDIVVTRSLTLLPLLLFGFSETALNAYLIFVAMLATFIHANVSWKLNWLQPWLSTPLYHHWHHASEPEAIDKNFAVHLPLLDRCFGTHYLPKEWPSAYGLHQQQLPESYIKQLTFPFQHK